MIEFIKHITGLCGEPHLNLITLLLSSPVFGYILYNYKIKNNDKN